MFSLRWFLRRLSPPKLPAPREKYIGLVHALSTKTKEDGTQDRWDQYWVLTEKAGNRYAYHVGLASTSPLAIGREASVEAWRRGGPLPILGYIQDGGEPPKPRKSRPEPKRASNIILLPRKAA